MKGYIKIESATHEGKEGLSGKHIFASLSEACIVWNWDSSPDISQNSDGILLQVSLLHVHAH